MPLKTLTPQRTRIRVTGVVQGVGFRPYIYRLATELALSGFVGNDGRGVFIEVEGSAQAIEALLRRLPAEAPPLAFIESVTHAALVPVADTGFTIVDSQSFAGTHTLVSPDLSICKDCLRELQDPTDRRYRYPFINCTNCGPRFTIIQDVPYDRPLTTMTDFDMCPACNAEYNDPLNRRFHAQPNACPDCGPQVAFVAGPTEIAGDDAVRKAVSALADGKIVAVKGIGGFHLACDATNVVAVHRLRARKNRPAKPFAIMAPDLDAVRAFAFVSDDEAALLSSSERPILLLRQRADAELSSAVAPDVSTIGVMLPYTPLHHLLMTDTPLVMTSANLSGEPIIKDNDEAVQKLAEIADAFLLHNRDIHVHCDDSVVRVEYPIRRSRGYAPFPVKLPFEVAPLLAVGGELKSTFCLTHGQHAFMSQHIGDMQNVETLHAFERATEHMQALFRVEPKTVVCDVHPGYLSARWAQQFANEQQIPLIRVQHHHAHIAAVMAENGLPADRRVIGFAFDGTGYGTDGAVWGGEILIAGYRNFERAAHLAYMPLPGGDAAVKRPYRLALAYLWACGIPWDDDLVPVRVASDRERRILRQQLARNVNTARTSSMGRLFDVVAALLGVRSEVSYEGQAAIELEAITADGITSHYEIDAVALAPQPILRGVIDDLRAGVARPVIAAKFHNTVVHIITQVSLALRAQHNLNTVALSGGVFQNVRLLCDAVVALQQHQFDVLVHEHIPPNDGGLALGQASIGNFIRKEQ